MNVQRLARVIRLNPAHVNAWQKEFKIYCPVMSKLTVKLAVKRYKLGQSAKYAAQQIRPDSK